MYTRASLTCDMSVILDTLSRYNTLLVRQIYKMFPAKEDVIKRAISNYIKSKRFYISSDGRYISISPESVCDEKVIKAFWVLLDFYDKVEYHTAGIFPVQINFFLDSEMYEIINIPYGQEAIVQVAISEAKEPAKRILIIDSLEQIPNIHVENIAGFCLITEEGETSYYKYE